MWKDLRGKAIQVLAEAGSNRIVQENAYELLYWFNYQLRQQSGALETTQVTSLLTDKEISEAIWGAATANPVSIRAITRLQGFPTELSKLGVNIKVPAWWTEALKGIPKSTGQSAAHNGNPAISA